MSSHQNGHPNRAVNRTHPERGIPQRAELVVQSAVPENTKAVRINFKFLQSGGGGVRENAPCCICGFRERGC